MQRVRHAQRLLATTPRKAIDIAFECGFPSSSRFYAAFAKFCGKTPGDYRGMLPHAIALAGPESRSGPEAPLAPVDSGPGSPAPAALSHLLWVDDQPLNNLDERRLLACRGFATDSYVCNRDALEALRTYSYSLVISDLARIGGRETGWDLLREVRARHPALPFLFFTDRVTPALVKRTQHAGAQGIFDRTSELVAAVLFHVNTPSPIDAGPVDPD
jgi:CheY-like chemotaxis protein